MKKHKTYHYVITNIESALLANMSNDSSSILTACVGSEFEVRIFLT